MKFKVFAKINLSLNVLTLEQEGYHMLDAVNQSISMYDTVTVMPRADKLCKVFCDKDIGVINTALTAANRFVKTFDTNGYDIYLEKGIPMAGGLGGSSADAAGVLAALSKLNGISLDEAGKIADDVGSDVKYMMTGGLARVGGRGEKVQSVECDSVLYFVIATPPFGMSTQRVFQQFDFSPDFTKTDNDKLIQAVLNEDVAAVKLNLYNDLQQAAFSVDDRLKKFFDKLKKFGFVSMSGSGSSMFFVCADKFESGFLLKQLEKEKIKAFCVESKNYGIEYI